MNIVEDKYKQPVQPKVYLGSPSNKPICVLNGVDESSFSITQNINNTYDITFDINRFVEIDGKEIESNGYSLLDSFMRIFVEGIGWFCIECPTVSNDGTREIKTIHGESAEIEMSNHYIDNLKINKGTTDSYEMLFEENVEVIDGVEFAKSQIKFCDKENEDLSLLHILLRESGIYGWTIGYIDNIPKVYKNYDNGSLVETTVSLSDEIGAFDFQSNNLYSTLTQELSQFFNCVFVFDFLNFTISAYRPEHLGKNTNINIGFRNLQNSNSIETNDGEIYTRYMVSGGEDLDIRYVNFGTNVVENLSYFLNEKYMSASLIEKYKLWSDDVESNRVDYIDNTRLYNAQQSIIDELYDRVPLDDCSTDWSTFPDDKLLEAKANYEAQIAGYESFYVDEHDNFDVEALNNSVDANDYYQILEVILPSIQIEIDNREILDPNSDEIQEYIQSYLTNWDLYGLDELQVKLDAYENTKKLCIDAGYNIEYQDDSGHTQDVHTEMYTKYLDAVNQLNPDFVGGCMEAYNTRKEEIETAISLQKTYDQARKEIAKIYDKTQWTHGDVSFSEGDLKVLSKLYKDTTYENENMFLTSSDNSVTAIDEQLKLLADASDDLEIYSQPQFIYTTSLDNFLAMPEFDEYTRNLEIGDFIYLGVRDDYVVKLRLISMTYNPLTMDNNLSMTFSNMLKSKSKRDDFINLIGNSGGSKGGSRSGDSSDYVQNEGVGLTPALIQKLVSSGAFSNKVSQVITNEYGSIIGGSGNISLSDLNNKLIRVVDLFGENGFFEYLQSKLIVSDKIVSDSGIFNQIFIEDGTVVRKLAAVEIDGDLIKANSILANKLRLLGEDGIYYQLNINSLGELTVEQMIEDGEITLEEFQNGLHGSNIISKTVTAEKIYVDDLNAFDATIGGFHIGEESIHSGEKEEIGSSIAGIYQDKHGQFEVGNGDNYIRFYKYENDEFHLELKVDSITLRSGDTIEEFVDGQINTKVLGEDGRLSLLEQDVEGFKSTVAGTYSTKTEVTQTESGLEAKITDSKNEVSNDFNLSLSALKSTLFGEDGDISQLKQLIDGITASIAEKVGEDYIKSQLELSAKDLILKFENKAKEIDDDLQEKYNTITTFFNFAEALTIGKSDSLFKTVISNEFYQMLINNIPALTLDPDGNSIIPQLRILKMIDLLGLMIDRDEYGNVNCEYIGTEVE